MYEIGQEEIEAVRRVIESGQLFRYRGGEGGETDHFEAEWAAAIGVKHAITVTSGTAALICGLAGLEIGPGDEVIVPAYTWIATAMAPIIVGAIPIMAEVDETLTIAPDDAERKITKRTKAIIPVHMSGFPANLDRIMAVARKHGLLVLEDSCQADGGSYKGRRLGSIGDAGAFSFNHFKIITCGEGGAVVTSDDKVWKRALIHHDTGCCFRGHGEGIDVPYFIGTNFRMNEILSAILRVQLGRLEDILARLRREKQTMIGELSGMAAFRPSPSNDPQGDCGTTLGLLFEQPPEARAFIGRLKDAGYDAGSAIESGSHVYTNWSPVIEKRGAHHPGRNPFLLCGYEVNYAPDMCPRTLEYLARTVYMSMRVDRPEAELRALIGAVKKAAS